MMLHRGGRKNANPTKSFIWRLPVIPGDLRPPEYTESDKMLVIIPLFAWNGLTHGLKDYHAQSACWARRSWIDFTDAIEKGVAVKFYVGEGVALKAVTPILKKNGIDTDKDILTFDESPFENISGINPALGKKLNFCNDKQLAKYDWVIQADTDLFVASPDRSKMDFFDRLLTQHLKPGAIWSLTGEWLERGDPPYRTIYDESWQRMAYDGTHEEKSEQWLTQAEILTDKQTADRYRSTACENPRVHGAMYAFPAKYFHAFQIAECEWLFEAGRRLQEDEGIFSLYQERGKTFWSISDTLGIPFAGVVKDMIARRGNGPYFCHPGDIWQPELIWRHDIDAMCSDTDYYADYEGHLK